MEEKVVAHYRDGRTLRGHTHDFKPEADMFHLLPSEGGGIPTQVRLTDLKALFYVRDYGMMRRQVERTRAEVVAARSVVAQLDEGALRARVAEVLANRPATDDHDFACDSLRDNGPIVRTGLFPE